MNIKDKIRKLKISIVIDAFIIISLRSIIYFIINGYLSCDGTFVRTLFWFECLRGE